MARSFARLTEIQYVPSTVGAVYTKSSTTTDYVKKIKLFNGTASAVQVKLYNVPDSSGSVGTAGASNQFAQLSVASGETIILDEDYADILEDDGDSIQAEADTTDAVTIQIFGATE